MTSRDAPLLIYHHLPRTGGTSLLAVVLDNYPPGAVRKVYGGTTGTVEEGAFDSVDTYRDWYESLPKRPATKCIASHNANLLMPTLNQPFRALCLLRDPAERVWSLYHGLKQVAHMTRRSSPGIERGREIIRRGWGVADIYRELAGGDSARSPLHDRFQIFFNDQTRRILTPWQDTSTLAYSPGGQRADTRFRDDALEILNRHYLVGTTEQYETSLARFAAAFGWNRLDAKRIDRSVGRRPLDAETRSLILAHNQLDKELHAHFTRMIGQGLTHQKE
jgi:hypothetical protein